MKCFAAFALLTLIGLPLLGAAVYALFTVQFLAKALALAVAAALVWAIVTAIECLGG